MAFDEFTLRLMCKTGVTVEIHRCLPLFLISRPRLRTSRASTSMLTREARPRLRRLPSTSGGVGSAVYWRHLASSHALEALGPRQEFGARSVCERERKSERVEQARTVRFRKQREAGDIVLIK